MEEYYRELEVAMRRVQVEEDLKTSMARFFKGIRPRVVEVLRGVLILQTSSPMVSNLKPGHDITSFKYLGKEDIAS